MDKYDVFISFRGEDTRYNFTGHLHSALTKKHIRAYMDEIDLDKGDEISSALINAIQDSKLCLIVFSKNYATSSWCLDELVLIDKFKGIGRVIPVFYHVKPSTVQNQEGSYELGQRFKGRPLGEVLQWKEALTKVGKISGRSTSDIRSESLLVDSIVEDVIKKLKLMPSRDEFLKDGFVGVNKHIREIGSRLEIGSSDIRTVGIWGPGGIGKTTLAQLIFDQMSSEFDACSFLENVREELEKHGPNRLAKTLLCDLFEGENVRKFNQFVKDRLCCTKVLLVFDDVDDAEVLEKLHSDWLGPGSRIIVTSRNKQVLRNIQDSEMYEVEGLNDDEALALFLLHSFKKKLPTAADIELSKRVIRFAGGIPLVLKVFGRNLYSKSKEEWENALNKLQKFPDKKIERVLRISYDGLDDSQKDIFLDIACFFKGESADFVKGILDGCDFNAIVGIEDLIDKALITVDRHNLLHVHDMLQVMAFKIVSIKSIEEPRKGTRLWRSDDIYHALTYNQGIEAIEGISLDTSKLDKQVCMSPTTFSKMCNLRLLIIKHGNKVLVPEGPVPFLDALRYLRWDSYPFRSLPTDHFSVNNLVALKLPGSQLERLWDGVVPLHKLKDIDLRGSRNLTQLPDLSLASNIERVELDFCDQLTELPSSFQHLNKVEDLTFSGCSSLYKLAPIPNKLRRLCLFTPPFKRRLDSQCDQELCRSQKNHPCLSFSYIRREPSPTSTPYYETCSRLERFPEIMEPMECLQTLSLEFTDIKELPASIKNLTGLEELNLSYCPNLELLPESISSLSCLTILNVCYCVNLRSLPSLPSCVSEMDASGCKSLKTVSSWRSDSVVQNWDDLYKRQSYRRERLMFYGCQNLDECSRETIVDEARYKILRCATLAWKYGHHDSRYSGKNLQISNQVCLAGGEIPSWFSNESEGSSISIKLGGDENGWYNSSYLGMALCVIVEFNDLNLEGLSYSPNWTIYCDSLYKSGEGQSWPRSKNLYFEDYCYTSGGCYLKECCHSYGIERKENAILTDSEYMFVFVDDSLIDEMKLPLSSSSISAATTASFSFGFLYEGHVKINKCGVHLLYSQEAENLQSPPPPQAGSL